MRPADEENLTQLVAVAERARGRRTTELTTDDMLRIALELEIPENDVLAALTDIGASTERRAIVTGTTKETLFLMSGRIGFRWPIVVRVFGAIGFGAFSLGWLLRLLPTSPLMAMSSIPFAAIAAWYLYRCIALSVERVALTMNKTCQLRVRSLPLAGRFIAAPIEQVDILPPEMATDEDGGFEIAPLHCLPLRIGGQVVDICTGHKKADLLLAYDRISGWLRAKRS